MDRLEKFIKENKEGMDSAVPDLKVWANIDKKLEEINAPHQKKNIPIWQKIRRVAAALLFLFAIVGGSNFYMNNNSYEASSLGEVYPQHAEMEQYYNEQVKQKIQQLTSYKQEKVVELDLLQLDEMFNELLLEFKEAPKGSEERIIQAMIKNYQAKLDILEHVIEKVEESNQLKKTIKNEISL